MNPSLKNGLSCCLYSFLCFIAAFISLSTEVSQTLFILHLLEWYKIRGLSHKQDQNIQDIFGNESNSALARTEKHLPRVCKTSMYGQNMAVRAGLMLWYIAHT